MKTLIFCVSLLFVAANASAQVTSYIVESSNLNDIQLSNIAPGPNNGHYITGTYYLGAGQAYVCQTGSSGQIIWEKRYPRPTYVETVNTMDADPKSIYVAGVASQFAAWFNYGFIMRLNSSGEIRWKVAVDSANSAIIWSVICLPDGGCIGVGASHNSFQNDKGIIVRLDSMGNVLWSNGHNITGRRNCTYRDLAVGSDGSVYCVGSSVGYNFESFGLLVKYSPTGQLLWSKEYQSAAGQNAGFNILMISDDCLFMGGTVNLLDSALQSNPHALILKADTTGGLITAVVHSPLLNSSTNFGEFCITPYNTLAISGTRSVTIAQQYDQHGYIGEYDASSLEFIRGTRAMQEHYLSDITIDSASNMYFCGSNGYDIEYSYGAMNYGWYPGCGYTPYTTSTETIALQFTNKTSILHTITVNFTSCSVTPTQVNQTLCVNGVSTPETSEENVFRVFPNPADEYLQIEFETVSKKSKTITITDAEGKIVRSVTLADPYTIVVIPTFDLACGIYFVQTEDQFLGKFVVGH